MNILYVNTLNSWLSLNTEYDNSLNYHSDFSTFVVSGIVIMILALILLTVNKLGSVKKGYLDKDFAFECGFKNFVQTRERFNILFYRIGLLFLIFDMELVLVYPFIPSSYYNSSFGMWSLIAFIVILTIGFVYELGKGALDIIKY